MILNSQPCTLTLNVVVRNLDISEITDFWGKKKYLFMVIDRMQLCNFIRQGKEALLDFK